MANVSIKFNNKEFLLSCDDGQEEHLEELLIQINQKFNHLKNDLGNLGENKLLLITAVKIMDEYYETKKKVDQKKQELKDLSNKFKELKTLIYEYKDKKEEEIKELNLNHDKLKIEIETNQKKVYPDILIVPLLAFDKQFNRLGYGGGFYDRYIEKIEIKKKVFKVGFAFSFQELKEVPVNNYDKKLDLIITERGLIF